MRALQFNRGIGERLCVLCLGAHSDDIEIGAGGTLLSLVAAGLKLDVHWCVLSARGQRNEEARASALDFLEGAGNPNVVIADFDDSFFPAQGREIKEWVAALSTRIRGDVVFTQRRDEADQDQREVNQIT